MKNADNNSSWYHFFKEEENKEYYNKLMLKLLDEYKRFNIYPPFDQIFKAFEITSYDDVKVVILGQDPYYHINEANGLAFSVNKGISLPPSLKNIYKEIENEFSFKMSNNGDLTSWARQGVLLLNTVLTVRENQPNSHQKIGWDIFTDNVIKYLNMRKDPIIFILWGNNSIKKEKLITNSNHIILKGVHPSPLSSYRGFFGCNHFKIANEMLTKNRKVSINWKI